MLPLRTHAAAAAISTLVAVSGHAAAQSFTIDPDGLGETSVTVGGSPLTSLGQLVPGVTMILGVEPAGSLLINGPWASDSFAIRHGFASTLRLEGGVDLQDITLTSLGVGGGTSTASGRIELDNSTLSVKWRLPFPGDTNGLAYQVENNSHLSLDFVPYFVFEGGWGRAPFEVGLTEQTIVTSRTRDLRVTRVPTGSTVTIAGNTHITRADGAAVAANGHNIIIDGGTWETFRLSGETQGDPSVAEGGIDFRSGTIRILDRYAVDFTSDFGEEFDIWDTDQSFNQPAMDALLAGVSPGTPSIPVLVAGQTLEFSSWYNPDLIGVSLFAPLDGPPYYEDYSSRSTIASTLEIRGGRLLLGPEGGWQAGPDGAYPLQPTFFTMQTQGFNYNDEAIGENGPSATGPLVLDGGRFDFSFLEFRKNSQDPANWYHPQFRAGTMRGFALEFWVDSTAPGLPLFGSPGKMLVCEIEGSVSSLVTAFQFADGATVDLLSPDMQVPQIIVGDGSTVTLDHLELTLAVNPNGIPVRVGLDSTLLIGRFEPARCDIGEGSVVTVETYVRSPGITSLSTGPGTLRLMPGALARLAPARRAFTVGGNLELDPAGTLTFGLLGPGNSTHYTVGGDLDLVGCGLSVTLADEFFTEGERVLMDIGGTTTGTFAGFPEGTLVESRLGVDLYLSYTGGDGNDIVLTTDGACAGDLNGDGLLDLADINIFVQAFVSQSPVADLNGDGLFDLSDINAFVTAFVGGC